MLDCILSHMQQIFSRLFVAPGNKAHYCIKDG